MKEQQKLMELLAREEELLQEAQMLTEEMETAPVEELPSLMKRRGRFLEEAHSLHAQAKRLCGERMQAVVDHRVNRGGLTPDEGAAYDASLRVKAAVNRIRNNSALILERMQAERDRMKNRLDELDSDSTRTMKRYAHVIRGSRSAGEPQQKKRMV